MLKTACDVTRTFFKLYITSMATSHYIPSISFLSAPDEGHLGGNVLHRESNTWNVAYPGGLFSWFQRSCLTATLLVTSCNL